MQGRAGTTEFNFSFQVKIIAMLLRDEEFSREFAAYIQPGYFSSPPHQVIFTKVQRLIEEFGRVPSLEVVIEELEQVEDEEIRNLALRAFGDALDVKLDDADYYRKKVFEFVGFQNMVMSMRRAAQFVKAGDIEAVVPFLEKQTLAVNQLAAHDFGTDYWSKVGLNEIQIELPKIPTLLGPPGSGGLDDILKGGLAQTELGMMMMPTGNGKSIFLVNLAGNAMLQSRNVVFVSLEMSEMEIRNRFSIYLSGLPYEQMRAVAPSALKEKILGAYPNLRLGQLLLKSFPMRSVTVPQIEAFIRAAEKRYGWKADMVCIDYLETIKPSHPGKEDHQRQGETSEELKGLAQKLQVPVWTVTQARRTQIDKRLLSNEDASGSYAKIFAADVVLTMKPEYQKDIGKTYGKMNTSKVRNGVSQRVLNFELDFDVMRYLYLGEVDFEEAPASKGSIRSFLDGRRQQKNR